MRKKAKAKKMNILMLELICTLGILMVMSVFIIRLFLGANSLERKARDVSKACMLIETIADTIKGCPTIEEALEEMKLQQIQDNHLIAVYEKYYDGDWRAKRKPSKYRAIVVVEQQEMSNNTYHEVDITIKKEKKYPVIKNDSGCELASVHIASYK